MNVEKLINFYPHPLLLLGAPGVGKSETVRKLAECLAERMRLKFKELTHSSVQEVLRSKEPLFIYYDLRLTEVEPCDLMGLPRETEEGFAYKPPLWALCFARHPGVLFLDEITNVQRDDVVSASYKIILERRVGDVQFSPDVWVIAAGNTPEHSAIARELPAPLINRVIVVNFPPPSLDEWAEYMNTKGTWDRRVYAYLNLFPLDFLKPERTATLQNFPTPRTWTYVAQMLTRIADNETERMLVTGLLGSEVGEKFLTFLHNPIPSVEQILDQPTKFQQLSIDEKYMFTAVFSTWLINNPLTEKAEKLIEVLAERERELLLFLFSCLPSDLRVQLYKKLSANKTVSEILVSYVKFMVGFK